LGLFYFNLYPESTTTGSNKTTGVEQQESKSKSVTIIVMQQCYPKSLAITLFKLLPVIWDQLSKALFKIIIIIEVITAYFQCGDTLT